MQQIHLRLPATGRCQPRFPRHLQPRQADLHERHYQLLTCSSVWEGGRPKAGLPPRGTLPAGTAAAPGWAGGRCAFQVFLKNLSMAAAVSMPSCRATPGASLVVCFPLVAVHVQGQTQSCSQVQPHTTSAVACSHGLSISWCFVPVGTTSVSACMQGAGASVVLR